MTLSLSHRFHSLDHCASWRVGFFPSNVCPAYSAFYISIVLLHWLGGGPHCLLPGSRRQPEDRRGSGSPSGAAPSSRALPLARRSMLFHRLQMKPACQTHSPSRPSLTPACNVGFPSHPLHSALLLPKWPLWPSPDRLRPFCPSSLVPAL